MKRVKKPKKKEIHKETKTPYVYVKMTNYLNMAVIIRTLYMVYGWREKRLAKFIESYVSLMEEIMDHRNTVNNFIAETTELTGIDVEDIFND